MMQRIQLRSPNPSPAPEPSIIYERQLFGGIGSAIGSFLSGDDTTTRQTTTPTTTTPTSTPTTGPTTTSTPITTTPSTSSTPTTTSSSTSSTPTTTSTTSSSTSLSVSVGSSTQENGSVVPVTRTATTIVQVTGRPASDNSGSSRASSNAGLIGGVVGGVVGGLLLLVIALSIFFLVRRRKARTGSGWFLCFGTKPDNDGDIFDPSEGAHGRNGGRNLGATLPQGFDDEDPEAYNDMSEYPHSNSAGLGAAAAVGAGAGAYYGNSSFGDHQSQGPQSGGNLSSNHDYSHFDPPEVRAERAREAAEAAAAARSQSSHNTGGGNHPSALIPGSSNVARSNSFGQSNEDHSFNAFAGGLSSPPAYADAPEPLPNSREAAVLDDDEDYHPARPAALGIANPDHQVDQEASTSRPLPLAPGQHNHPINPKDPPPASTNRRE